MSKSRRQTKRKVVIRYIGRNPDDPLALLEAVDEAFRPKDIEIQVETDEESEPERHCPDEQLETLLRAAISEQLDRRAFENGSLATPDADAEEQARRSIRQWLVDHIKAGWRIVVAVIPVLERVKKLVE